MKNLKKNMNGLLPGSKKKGVAILMALFMALLMSMLTVPILDRAVGNYIDSYREARFITAIHAAESGIEDALWHLSFDKEKAWTGWNTQDPKNYLYPKHALKDANNKVVGEVSIQIEDPLPLGQSIFLGPGGNLPFPLSSKTTPTIVATAGVPSLDPGSEIRRVQVLARSVSTFSLGLFSDKELDLGGTTVVNSYKSSLGAYGGANVFGNGDSGSNGDIVLNGTPLVDGDASAGGTVIMKGAGATITGEVQGGMTTIDLPPVNAEVAAAKLANNNGEIPKGVKANGTEVSCYSAANKTLTVNAGVTLTLPGGTPDNPKIYYFSGGSQNGQGTIKTTGSVIIFTDGSLDFNGGIEVSSGSGKPADFQVYSSGTSSTTLKFNGGAGFYGCIYAPSANVVLGGGGNVYGSAVAGKISLSGNPQFHYDEDLGETGLIVFFAVQEWVEKPVLDYSYGT